MDSLVVLNPDASGVKKNLTRIRGSLADSSVLSAAEVKTLASWEGGREAAARAAGNGCGLVVAAGETAR